MRAAASAAGPFGDSAISLAGCARFPLPSREMPHRPRSNAAKFRRDLRRAKWTPKWTPKGLKSVGRGSSRLCLVTSEDQSFWKCNSDDRRPIPTRASN